MKHLGDITKINGGEVPAVDVIIGGSPCQDLSVAGKRKGLSGERSGLFMEQIQIVKEMRERDARAGRTGSFIRPRYMVWENVPGAFSSSGGEDFRAVLEEIVGVKSKGTVIPRPPDGKWRTAGLILGDGYSVAWRVLDARFWGVPQRRRRIALVADFGGISAGEILFNGGSLQGDSAESGETGEGVAAGAQRSAGKAGSGLEIPEEVYPDFAHTLTARYDGSPCVDRGGNIVMQRTAISFNYKASPGSGSVGYEEECAPTLRASESVVPATFMANNAASAGISHRIDETATLKATNGGIPVTYCIQGNCIDRSDTAGCNGKGWKTDESYTLNTIDRPAVYDARGSGDGKVVPTITGDHESRINDYAAIVMATGQANAEIQENISPTLSCNHEAPILMGTLTPWDSQTNRVYSENGEYPSLSAREKSGMNRQSVLHENFVRRLTPLECERLQGYPDGWTDIGDWVDSKGKKRQCSDAARYRALGNSIALPPWKWVLKRICAQYERDATMGSLFDGIGGFPYIWEQMNGKGSCLWASEIEEFPIAVTKRRINGEA